MKNKFIKVFVFLLFLPLRCWIGIINVCRKGGIISSQTISNFRTRLENAFGKAIEKAYLQQKLPVLQGLTYLDIGARDGLPQIVDINRASFSRIILCEGEPAEARRLRDAGYLVIDKFLADRAGDATFYYIKEHPGASSLLKPGTAFLHFFSSTHLTLYSQYTESKVITSTLDEELKKLDVQTLDFMKVDVQGSELSILKGLTTVSPLFIEMEVLPLPTYQGAPYGTMITAELVRRGYICFRQNQRMCKDGIYIYSNEMYMPDYTKEIGRNLILSNLEKWRFLMKLFDMQHMADHIEQQLSLTA